MATGAVERYLEAIFEMADESGQVKVKDIAACLDISYPSVSEMVDRLVEKGLVIHDKYKRISLTPQGKRIAKGLDRKHKVIRDFFANVLQVDETVADRDACEIEHVISDETLNKLVSFLESLPRSDPKP